MNATLTEIIERLDLLSSTANGESQAMKAVAAGDKLLLDLESLKRATQFTVGSPGHQELKEFLKSLAEGQLYALVSLMYSGRDSHPDPVAYWEALKLSCRTRDDAIRTLIEKEPRMNYLRTAIARRPASLSIDELPSLLS
jgi:hypothetical protein